MANALSMEELGQIDDKIGKARQTTRDFVNSLSSEQERKNLLQSLSKKQALKNGAVAVAADLIAAPIVHYLFGVDLVTAAQVGIVGAVAADLYFARNRARRISQLS